MLYKKATHKVRFTPYRDENGVNRVWFCGVVDKEEKRAAHGIAILSPNDEPNDEVGRQLAYNKAVRALENRPVNRIVKAEAWASIKLLRENDFLSFAQDALLAESAFQVM